MKSMMILVAGPYRSGTNDDPEKMAENLRRLETVTLPIFRAGHIPMIGEWTVRRCGRLTFAWVGWRSTTGR